MAEFKASSTSWSQSRLFKVFKSGNTSVYGVCLLAHSIAELGHRCIHVYLIGPIISRVGSRSSEIVGHKTEAKKKMCCVSQRVQKCAKLFLSCSNSPDVANVSEACSTNALRCNFISL